MCKWIRDLGTLLSGAGTFILGIGALVASCQTSDVLKEIAGLKVSIDDLSDKVKNRFSEQIYNQPALSDPNASHENIESSLRALTIMDSSTTVRIPTDKLDAVSHQIATTPNLEDRKRILRSNAEVVLTK